MSGRRRLVWFAALLAPLLVAAAVLGGGGGDDHLTPAPETRVRHAKRAPMAPRLQARASERIARAVLWREAEAARREDPHGEPGPTLRVLRLHRRTGAEAEPAARRFFTAFSLYEVGRFDEAVGRQLRASTTGAIADRLLSAPPRVPPGLSRPERAYLGQLEFVPGEPDASGRRLVSGELVGVVQRGGHEEEIAIEVRRSGRGWLVSGLGR